MASELQRAQRLNTALEMSTRMLMHYPGIPASCSTRPWLQSWTAAELQAKQETEPNLGQILLWKQNQATKPTQREVQGTSKATKSLWAQWNWLPWEKGVLYCKWLTEDGCGTRLQLVLPYLLVPDILSSLHDAPSAGHLGVTKTVERVRK